MIVQYRTRLTDVARIQNKRELSSGKLPFNLYLALFMRREGKGTRRPDVSGAARRSVSVQQILCRLDGIPHVAHGGFEGSVVLIGAEEVVHEEIALKVGQNHVSLNLLIAIVGEIGG